MFSLRNNIFLILFFAFLSVSPCLAKEEVLPVLSLVSPQEGQILIKGNQYKIIWEYEGSLSGDAAINLISGQPDNFVGKTCNLGYVKLSQKQFILDLANLKNCQDFLKDRESYTISLQYTGYYTPVGHYINLIAKRNIILRFDTQGICGAATGQIFSQIPESGLCNYGELTSPLSAYDGSVFDGNWHWACENVKCSAMDLNQALKKQFTAWEIIDYVGESQNPTTIEYITQGPCSAFNIPAGYILSSCEDGAYSQIFGSATIKVLLKKGVACTQNYAPVCGQNHKTYPNECFAKRENIEVAHNGSCNSKIDGICGSVNGQGMNVRPSINLCQSGLASSVTKYSPWSWSCKGINGGADAQCSATELVKKSIPKLSAPESSSASAKPLNEMSRAELLMYLLKLLAALQIK